jgi:hypothetical protein
MTENFIIGGLFPKLVKQSAGKLFKTMQELSFYPILPVNDGKKTAETLVTLRVSVVL